MAGITSMLLFFPFTFIVWIICLPFDRNRYIIHRILIWQSKFFLFLIPGWHLITEGSEKGKTAGTKVIISNHQSMLDILILNSLGYRYKWISKIENTKVPVLGWYLKMAGYITVDRSDRESKDRMLAESLNCLRKGISIMIFPEGTRSADNEPGFFKRGAFQLAIEAGVPILPVILDGTGSILPKHGLIFKGRMKIHLKVMDVVEPKDFGTKEPEILAARFEELYRTRLRDLRNQITAG